MARHGESCDKMESLLRQDAIFTSKKIAAMKERANDVLVEQEKARILANNKELVAYTYR